MALVIFGLPVKSSLRTLSTHLSPHRTSHCITNCVQLRRHL